MEKTAAAAQTDLEDALKRSRKFVPTYMGLLGVAQLVASPDEATAIERRATHEVPTTYYIRQAYLRNLTPRWGGSYEQMEEYEASLNSAAHLNARIWSLKGESWAERGYTARLDNDAAAAVEYYTKALQYGDRMEFLKARATLYMALHDYAAAGRDFAPYRIYDAEDADVNRYALCTETFKLNEPCTVDLSTTPAR
ncbi:MAG: hypothetical protein JSS29_19785 [Proteobacteria bacterium]|nr:hypothetical protein [Pseudomonadota bacterium]